MAVVAGMWRWRGRMRTGVSRASKHVARQVMADGHARLGAPARGCVRPVATRVVQDAQALRGGTCGVVLGGAAAYGQRLPRQAPTHSRR